MAKRIFKLSETEESIEWRDAVSNRMVFSFRLDSLHPDLESRVRAYGLKQILADAGALPDGASMSDRLAAMIQRSDSLMEGSWGQATRMVDAAIYRAAVQAGKLTDSDEMRAKWRALPATSRQAVGRIPEVLALLGDEDGEDVLAGILGSDE